MPADSFAPRCGQRSARPKNSPSTLKTTISRPATATQRLPPGGISAAFVITYFGMVRSSCDSFPVGGDGAGRLVEVPVRVVAGKQQPIGAEPLNGIEQMARGGGLLDRLSGEVEV